MTTYEIDMASSSREGYMSKMRIENIKVSLNREEGPLKRCVSVGIR